MATSTLIAVLLWVFTGALGVPGSTLGIVSYSASLTAIPTVILTIIFVYLFVSAGDIVAYELAVFFSEKFRNRLRKFSFFRDNEEKARGLLKEYEFSIVFYTRFLFTGLCQVVSYVSGFERVSRKKFISAVLLGEFLFSVIYVLLGFIVGELLSKWIGLINNIVVALVALFVVLYLMRYVIRKIRRKRV